MAWFPLFSITLIRFRSSRRSSCHIFTPSVPSMKLHKVVLKISGQRLENSLQIKFMFEQSFNVAGKMLLRIPRSASFNSYSAYWAGTTYARQIRDQIKVFFPFKFSCEFLICEFFLSVFNF